MTPVIEQFNRDSAEAFQSLDETKIRAFFAKYNPNATLPAEPLVFWAAVHKAITSRTELPIEFRRKSKAYLTEHGFKSWDDGDL